MDATKKNSGKAAAWFGLCPVRHVLTGLGALLIVLYFALRRSQGAMEAVCYGLVRPLHRLLGRACNVVPFSVGEALIAAAALAVIVYLVLAIRSLCKKHDWLRGGYRIALTAVMCFCVVYGGFCLMWGCYYEVADFEQSSGISAEGVSAEQLESVTAYFAALVNEYGESVLRDENGLFAEPLDEIFALSPTLYDEVCESFPCLEGPQLRAKPFSFSQILSLVNFTGFFFPFTAEANINTDSPACLIPATIAHELAHQRGVAQEDEANFVAVLASLENGSAVYCYSACLLAYIHLGNALYKADYDAWLDVYSTLSEGVLADLRNNNEYWAQYETPVSTVSDTVYTGFLQSYGQTLRLQTYGACVDLLVAYYGSAAAEYEGAEQ
ncbi:MAG: DUF3810 domain-containing protein [Oscillospiraceae bacterium]|nr:DUF3810 domain-containing protein [Oscillospiraceae bacterium]